MNKVISIVCAVILGVIIMTPPLLVAPLYYPTETEVAPSEGERFSTDLKEENQDTQSLGGKVASSEIGTTVLSNILYVGSIVVLGLVVAVGVFSYAKVKMSPRT